MPPRKLTCDRSGMTRFASPPALCSTGTACAVPVAETAIALSVRFSPTPCAAPRVANTATSDKTSVRVPKTPANFRFILKSPRVKCGRLGQSRLSCSACWCGFNFAPDEVNGNAEQHDREPDKSLGSRLVRDQQNHSDCRRETDVQCGQNGVADDLIRTFGIRTQPAEPEQADCRQRVEDQGGKDDVIEQLPVRSAETE